MCELDDVINQLASSYTMEPKEKTRALRQLFDGLYDKDQVSYQIDCEAFFDELNDTISQPFINEGLKESDPNKLFIIPFLFNGLCNHFFKFYITSVEGSVCAGDKASFTIRQIKNALRQGENISLVQFYSEKDLGGEKYKDTQTYWSPVSIADTDSAIALFKSWYMKPDEFKPKPFKCKNFI